MAQPRSHSSQGHYGRYNFSALGAQTNVSLGSDMTSHIPDKPAPVPATAPPSRYNFNALGARANVLLGDDANSYETSNKQPEFHPPARGRFVPGALGSQDNVNQLFQGAPTYETSNAQPSFSNVVRNGRYNFNAKGAQSNVVLGETQTTYARSSDTGDTVARAQAAGVVPKQPRFNPQALAAQDNVAAQGVFTPEFQYASQRAARA